MSTRQTVHDLPNRFQTQFPALNNPFIINISPLVYICFTLIQTTVLSIRLIFSHGPWSCVNHDHSWCNFYSILCLNRIPAAAARVWTMVFVKWDTQLKDFAVNAFQVLLGNFALKVKCMKWNDTGFGSLFRHNHTLIIELSICANGLILFFSKPFWSCLFHMCFMVSMAHF